MGQEAKENTDFKLAIGLYNDGMYDLAIEQLHNFIGAYQTSQQAVEARFYLGLAQLKSKKYSDARETFQSFALSYSDNPKAPEAWLNVGRSYEAAGNLHEAASSYERVKVFHPKSSIVPEALLMAGTVYTKIAELESAKNCFKSILKDYPSSKSANKARLALGEADAQEGNISPALHEINQSLENAAPGEERTHALLILGRLQLRQALFTAAESTLTTILSGKVHNNDESSARFELGTLFLAQHQYSKAIPQLKLFLEDSSAEDSTHLEGMFALGQAYLQTGSYGNATGAFEAMMNEKENPHLSGRAMLGMLLTSIGEGDTKNTRKSFEYFISSPFEHDPSSIIIAADAAKNLGQYSVAAQLYTKYLDRFPTDLSSAGIMLELARLYAGFLNNTLQSDLLLNRIIEKFPTTSDAPAALRQIGDNACLRSDYLQAIRTYRDLLGRYPAVEYTDSIHAAIITLMNHRATSPDSALHALIDLVGDFADTVPRSELFYKLGLLYESGLKEYTKAKTYFLKSIDNGLTGHEKIEATVHIVRCTERESEIHPSLIPEVLSSCRNFLRNFPSTSWTDEIILAAYMSESSSLQPKQKVELAKQYMTNYPASIHRTRFLYDLATASLAIGDTVAAQTTFSSLLSDSIDTHIEALALIGLGRIIAHRQISDSSATLFDRAIRLSPVSPATVEAMGELAEQSWNRHSFSRALDLWKRLSAEFGYSMQGQTAGKRIPDGYFEMANYTEAVKGYEQQLDEQQTNPISKHSDPDLLSRLGEAYERHGDYKKAADLYKRYLIANPGGAPAANFYLSLGNISKTAGDGSLAAAYFHEAASLGMNVTPSRENADLLFENEQYQEAKRYYLTLAKTGDTTAKQYFQTRAIIASYRQNDLSEGDRLSKIYLESPDGNSLSASEIEYERGLALYRKQEYVEARHGFERVKNDFGKTPFGPWGWYYLGKISEILNKPEDAAGTYDDILNKFPSSDVIPRVLLSLGNMHFNAERYQQAISFYQKIISDSIRAGDVLIYALNNLIEADESLKLYDAALTATRLYLQRYPNDENILDKKIKIGSLYTKIGYYDQAIQQFETILSEAGNALEPELFYDIGEAYFYKGDYQQAILEFLKVPYTTGKSGKINWTATSLYMAGQSYEKLTKFAEAITMYQQIIDRPGIDGTFKSSARKEIARVKAIINRE